MVSRSHSHGFLGFFQPIQCHGSTGQCWCVVPDTGKAIDGTAKMHEMPECTSKSVLAVPENQVT